jgi:hypothetical protein
MTEDELVEGARWRLEQRGGPLIQASAEAVAELEAMVGYPMPALLRRLYLEVSDGWPSWIAIATMTQWYQGHLKYGENDPDEDGDLHIHPRTLVPVTEADCGCHQTFVEFGTAQGSLWLWNYEVGCSRHHWFAAPFTVADCVAHWAYGARLRYWRQQSNRQCPRCREGEGKWYGKCGMGIPDWVEELRHEAMVLAGLLVWAVQRRFRSLASIWCRTRMMRRGQNAEVPMPGWDLACGRSACSTLTMTSWPRSARQAGWYSPTAVILRLGRR